MDSTYLVTNYEGSGQTAEFPKHVQNGPGNYRPIHLVDSKIPMWQKDSYGILNNKCHKEIIYTLHAFHIYYDSRDIVRGLPPHPQDFESPFSFSRTTPHIIFLFVQNKTENIHKESNS